MLLAQRNEEVLIPALCDSGELYSGVSSSSKRLVLMHSYLYCIHTALGPNWHMLCKDTYLVLKCYGEVEVVLQPY